MDDLDQQLSVLRDKALQVVDTLGRKVEEEAQMISNPQMQHTFVNMVMSYHYATTLHSMWNGTHGIDWKEFVAMHMETLSECMEEIKEAGIALSEFKQDIH